MVLDELSYMSRFKGSKPIPRGVFAPSQVALLSPLPKPALSPSVTTPGPRPPQVQTPWQRASATFHQSDLNNPLRKLGLYLAIAFIFCRFSLLGELVSIKLNFDPHILRILGIPTVVLAVISAFCSG